jgi:hypothetical protein
MNKKYIIIMGSILVLALLAVGWIFIIKKQEAGMGPVSFDSFKKTDLDGKTIMENKKIGLSFEVPEGWIIRNDGVASVSIISPDFTASDNKQLSASIPQKGCWIGVTARIERENSSYDVYYSSIKSLIDNADTRNSLTNDIRQYDIADISGAKALKSIIKNNIDNLGSVVSIQLPLNNKVYFFETDLFGQDQEKCSQEFDNFLKRVSAK